MACRKDADVYDSWEDMEDDDVLEKKLNDILPNKQTSDNGFHKAHVNMIIVGDDALRTQYAPPEPTVKILKRPQNDSDKLMLNGDGKPKQPIKSLRQREQEYAEARLRILGEAKSPVDNSELSPKILTSSTHRSSEMEGIIRLPRGPDGTSGFKVRR